MITGPGAALASFDRSDASVVGALAHLCVDLDRRRLLALREARTVDAAREARALVAPLGSAILLERFAAETFAAAGAHEDALAARREALAVTPRWDSTLAARVLARTADSLVALGRHDEAVEVGARALRFMPGGPRTVASYAAALDAAGRAKDAASCRAWLHDIGVGRTVLARDASDDERAIDAYVPDLDHLEPLDEDGMARHLAFAYVDLGLANHLLQGLRHAMACLRYGIVHPALGTLDAYSGGTPNATDAGHWIGWPVGATDFVATDALRAQVQTVLRAVKTDSAAKKLRHSRPAVRAGAVETLVSEGKAPLAREGLFDRVAYVRFRASKALPDDNLVLRVKALEATLPPTHRLFSSADVPDGIHVSFAHHGGTRFVADRAAIEYPEPDRRAGPFDVHAPLIEPAPDARSSCKLCKARLAAGELRLRVRQKMFPVETFYTHLACAASGKRGPLLAASRLERDDGPLLLVALRRSRLPIPEREELLAALERR